MLCFGIASLLGLRPARWQVELISASFLCNKTLYCTGTFGWAVALGVISAVFTGVILLTSK
jgi:hypothetical protein